MTISIHFSKMENDPLNQLTVFYESKGYTGKEAVEKAEIELDKRRRERELELKQTAGKISPSFVHSSSPCLLSFSCLLSSCIFYVLFNLC